MIAVILCPQNTATWRNRPCLPSKACKLKASCGQSLQCCGPSCLCPACQGMELCSATDLALWATEVTAWSLGKVMSTLVVQERHLFLSLAETSDVDKELFLNASVSQAGLFSDTVEDCAQQFLAIQKQTMAIQHILHILDGPCLSAGLSALRTSVTACCCQDDRLFCS